MAKSGCTFNGGTCHTVIEKCYGCEFIVGSNGSAYCKSFADPASKWLFGLCNMATHVERKSAQEEKKINPLKASKKASQGKL